MELTQEKADEVLAEREEELIPDNMNFGVEAIPLTQRPTLSEEEMESMLSSDYDLAGDPSNIVRQYNPSSGQFVEAPQGASTSIKNVYQQISNGEKAESLFGDTVIDDDRYATLFGTKIFGDLSDSENLIGQLKRMAATGLDMSVGVAGAYLQTAGELAEAREPFAGFKDPFDFKRMVSEATPTGFMARVLSQIDDLTGLDASDEFIRAGAFLQGANDMMIAEWGLREEEPTWIGLIGEGAVSLAASVGLFYVTGNPVASTAYFQTLQETDAYKAAIDSGMDVRDAAFYSSIEGTATAALEYIGLSVLMKSIGGKGANAVKGFFSEGTQEFSQELVEISGRMFADIEEIPEEEIVNRLGISFTVGGFLGATTGVAFGKSDPPLKAVPEHEGEVNRDKIYIMKPDGTVELSLGALERSIAKDVNTLATIASDSNNEVPSLAPAQEIKKKRKIVEKIINDFMNGVAVDPVMHSTKEMRKKVQAVIDKMKTNRMEVGDAVRAGKLLVLQEQLIQEQAKLSEIEQKGEELARKHHEKYKDRGYSQETLDTIDAVAQLIDEIDQEMQDVDTTSADGETIPLHKLFGAIREQYNEIAEFIDEAEYMSLVDELQEDQEYIDSLQELAGYKRIEKQYARQVEKTEDLIDRIATVESLGGEEALTRLTREKITIRAGILKKLEEFGYNNFFKAMKLSRRMTLTEHGAVNKELKKFLKSVMDSLPSRKDDPLGLSKREKDVIQKGMQNYLMRRKAIATQEDLLALLPGLQQKASMLIEKVYKDKFKALTEGDIIAKYNKKDKSGRKVTAKYGALANDAISVMAAIYNGEVTPESVLNNLSKDTVATEGNGLVMAYAIIKAVERDTEPGQTGVTSSEWGTFYDNFNNFLGIGKESRNKYLSKKKATKKRDVKDSVDALNTIPQGKDGIVRRVIRKSSYIIPDPIWDGTKSIKDWASGKAAILSLHYNTIVELFGLENTVFGTQIEHDKKFRERVFYWNERFNDMVKSSGMFSKTFNKNKFKISTKREKGKAYSVGQLLTIYMYSLNQATRKRLVEENGISEQDLGRIEEYLGAEGIEVANQIIRLYDEMYINDINPAYRQEYGHNLAKIEFYTPVNIAGGTKDDQFSIMDHMFDTDRPGYFSARYGTGELSIEDALFNYGKYVRGMQSWVVYHSFYERVKNILNDPDFKFNFEKKFGKINFNALKVYSDKLKNNQNGSLFFGDAKTRMILSNFITSRIGGAPQITWKQMTTAALSLGDINNPYNWGKYMLEFHRNPIEIFKMLQEHDTLKYRGAGFMDPETSASFGENKKFLPSKLIVTGSKVKDVTTLNVRVGDQYAVAAGAYAIMRDAESKGIPRERALDIGMDWAERTQQSSLPSNRTPFSVSADGNALLRLMAVFSTSPIALFNYEVMAMKQHSSGKITRLQMLRKVSVVHSLALLFGWISSGFDDEDFTISDAFFYFMLGPASAIPIMGDMLSLIGAKATEVVTGEEPDYIKDTGLADNPILDVYKNTIGSLNNEEYVEAFAEVVGILTGVPAENLHDMSLGVGELVGSSGADGWLKLQGFSDYVVEKQKDGSGDEEVVFTGGM